jgi:hypothetical protein
MSFLKVEGKFTNVPQVVGNLTAFRSITVDKLLAAMQTQAAEMKAELANAAGHFRRRTGKLQKAAYAYAMKKGDEQIVLRAGVKKRAFYGLILEKGASGAVQVKAHVRKMGAGTFKAVPGKVNKAGTRQQVKFEQASQGIAYVKAYTRNVHMPPRPFARPIFERRQSVAFDQLKAALGL